MEIFEKQALQIAALGVWQIVTNKPMKKKLELAEDERWQNKSGVFVTLRKEGKVRGSIGLLESTTSLPETLFDAGSAAASHDQRFKPLENDEIPSVEIEVTLLSQAKKLATSTDLIVGEMGLIVSRGENRGVLLPSVAIENKWNALEFLEACCEKAQLPHQSWLDPNTLVESFKSITVVHPSLISLIGEFV